MSNLPEAWMRGPVSGIPPLLQPVAHTLTQVREEVNALMTGFPENLLWERPAGVASVGFHLQHLSGVLDRLFTYAKGNTLSDVQLANLEKEGKPGENSLHDLLRQFNLQISCALAYLEKTDENTLTDYRGVGRKQLPSTVAGLLFHAAEHSMRHTGQMLVTVKILDRQEILLRCNRFF